MPRSEKAIREAARAFAHPDNFDLSASSSRQVEGGFECTIAPGKPNLVLELTQAYASSGGAVGLEFGDLRETHLSIPLARALELLNTEEDRFAPIRLYCPEACGETLDLTKLLDKAQVAFDLNRSELKQLSYPSFSRLIECLVRWQAAKHPEDKAKVLDRVVLMRSHYIEDRVVLKALLVFPEPDPPPQMEPETETASAPKPVVILVGIGGRPIVRGVEKDRLTIPQFNTIKALLGAGERGLTKDNLIDKSGHSDAVGIIDRLRKKDPEWGAVIQMGGKPGGRYRIVT